MSHQGKNPKANWINFTPQAADPGSPNEGDTFYSDGTPRAEGLWVYINSVWSQISTGATLSVLDKITLTPQSADPSTPTDGMIFNSNGTPRAAGIWEYNGSGWVQLTGIRYQEFYHKQSYTVRIASTANLTLASQVEAGDTIDGVVLVAGNIVLLKDQTTASENGVYVVQASGAPVRDTSADSASELNNFVAFVNEGTVNSTRLYFQNNTLTSLSDAQSWSTTPSTRSFVVPYGVNELHVEACGAGGSAGGGGGGGAGGRGGGGSGGAGSTPQRMRIKVTPADTLTLTVGWPGQCGLHGGSGASGINGGAGNHTTITGTGVNLFFPGGGEGLGGVGNGGAGGAAVSTYGVGFAIVGLLDAGTSGAGSTGGGSAGAGVRNLFTTSASSAGASGSGSGGGGGGSSFGAGGNGGSTGVAGGAGGGTAAGQDGVNYGSGGGGGWGGPIGGSSGTRGGIGATGYIKLSWS